MNKYLIKRVEQEPDWASVPALQVDQVLWLEDVGVRMQQQICYSADAIYVHQQAVESDIRAEFNGALDPVCKDSCMEFFFGLDEQRYFNFEINPNGCITLGFRRSPQVKARLVVPDPKAQFSIRTARTDNGWEVFYQIPLQFLKLFYPDFRLESGVELSGNCYKCGEWSAHPHFLAWNRVTSESPDFHRPCDFGRFLLE